MSVETDLKVMHCFVRREVAANDRFHSDGTSLFFGSISNPSSIRGGPYVSGTSPALGSREHARWSDHCRFHGLAGPEHAAVCPLVKLQIILRRTNNLVKTSYSTSPAITPDPSSPLSTYAPISIATLHVLAPLYLPYPVGIVPENIEVRVAAKVTPPTQREMEL